MTTHHSDSSSKDESENMISISIDDEAVELFDDSSNSSENRISISIDDELVELFDDSSNSPDCSMSSVVDCDANSASSRISVSIDDVPADLFGQESSSISPIHPRVLFGDPMSESGRSSQSSFLLGNSPGNLFGDQGSIGSDHVSVSSGRHSHENMEEEFILEDEVHRNDLSYEEPSTSNHGSDDELPSFDTFEWEDMYHADVNHFPTPLVSGHQGTLLHLVTCSFDVDSIYFIGRTPSEVLEYMGDDGTCELHSAVNRTYSTNSSRIAVDYHGVEHLMPSVRGRKLKRLKVLSLHHFPNIELVKVFKAGVKFWLNLHILQPEVLTGCNYFTHKLLLALICALNIAIDGKFPYGEDDEDYGTYLESRFKDQWSILPYFELQDGSKKQRKHIRNCHKHLSIEAATAFFFRFEKTLKLMATSPNEIDPEMQNEDMYTYWRRKQGMRRDGSGSDTPLTRAELSHYASILVEKTITVACAAGTKKSYKFPEMDAIWRGSDEAVDQEGGNEDTVVDEERIYQKFSTFRRHQFSNIKKSLETSFPGMEADHPLFHKVHSFIDVGIELRPHCDNMLLLADLQRSKQVLSQIISVSVPDDGNLSMTSTDSVVSDDDEMQESEAVGEASTWIQSDFFDRLLEVKALRSMNFYRTHFTRTLGNTHTASVRMNAVQENTTEDIDKVILALPTLGFFRGGQIYEPYVRLESMHQQRPQRDDILSIIPHSMNIFRKGGHLLGTTVAESMQMVSVLMTSLGEIYDHRRSRRANVNSNVLRIELFVAYMNGEDVVGSLPHFDPTSCVEMFNKQHVDAFEESIVQSHFVPCQTLLGSLGRLVEQGRLPDFDYMSSALQTRAIGSLEIAVLYVAGNFGHSFIIQKNILSQALDRGITVDIPPSVKVNVSELEKSKSGFQYGILPSLLPHSDDFTAPPLYLHDITALDISSKFPPYFSAMDRSVARSLNLGMNVGRLERTRNRVDAIIHRVSRTLQDNDSALDSGVLDDMAYDLIMLLPPSDRLSLLEELARLLVICYCVSTWEIFKKGKVFGNNPENIINEEGEEADPEDFENFPFVERRVNWIMEQLEETRFVRKDDLSGSGKGLLGLGLGLGLGLAV
jgi:hypothetical protein